MSKILFLIFFKIWWLFEFNTYNEKLGLGPSFDFGRNRWVFIIPLFARCNGCRPFACRFLDQLGNGTGSLLGNGYKKSRNFIVYICYKCFRYILSNRPSLCMISLPFLQGLLLLIHWSQHLTVRWISLRSVGRSTLEVRCKWYFDSFLLPQQLSFYPSTFKTNSFY